MHTLVNKDEVYLTCATVLLLGRRSEVPNLQIPRDIKYAGVLTAGSQELVPPIVISFGELLSFSLGS